MTPTPPHPFPCLLRQLVMLLTKNIEIWWEIFFRLCDRLRGVVQAMK